MKDVDGVPIAFSLNRDGTVSITICCCDPRHACHGDAYLDVAKADEFTRLWFEALRQAGENAEVVDATIHAADCMDPDCKGECDG